MKATPVQQSVILLALATSSLLTVKDKNLLPDQQEAVDIGISRMLEIIREFPADRKDQFHDVDKIMKRVSAVINKPDSWFSTEIVVFLGHRICSDLLTELRNPVKRELVSEALLLNQAINDVLDPDGNNEEAFIEVEQILKEVYEEIGFTVENRFSKRQFRRLRKEWQKADNQQKMVADIKLE